MRTIVAFALIFFIGLSNLIRAEDLEAPAGAKLRSFQFSYTAAIEAVPEGAKSIDLWIPVPQDSVHQTITNLKFSTAQAPEIGVEPEMGNKIAHWKIDAAAAKGLSVTMTFDCVRKEVSATGLEKTRELTAEERTAQAKWLKANKLVWSVAILKRRRTPLSKAQLSRTKLRRPRTITRSVR